jgi:hypothetical protein
MMVAVAMVAEVVARPVVVVAAPAGAVAVAVVMVVAPMVPVAMAGPVIVPLRRGHARDQDEGGDEETGETCLHGIALSVRDGRQPERGGLNGF